MSKKVIILGGGVAGMSAAHELMERGFQVTVYEKKSVPGGKARSVHWPGSGKDGRHNLPGEHGFRFFPSFYHHVTDTMKRIPYGNNKQGVFDNLTNTTQIGITQFGKHDVLMLAQFPRSFEELKILLNAAIDLQKYVGLTKDDIEFFGGKLWQYLTTCQDRRMDDLEKIGWWEYSDAGNRSEAYQKFLAQGLTRSLVAANAHVANAKVEGDVGIQLILGLSEPGVHADRVLNGPTNEVWIGPWLEYLRKNSVEYCMESEIRSIECDGKVITGVTLQRPDGSTFADTADYYILAVPVEQARKLLMDDKQKNILKADSTLAAIKDLGKHVAWMNGIQFYLTEDAPMVHGHMIHIDTPWALTTISQAQFWKWDSSHWKNVGDGRVKGIISVDISEWGSEWHGQVVGKGILYDKVARDCRRPEIINEVWAQLEKSVNVDGTRVLGTYDSVFIDPDIEGDPDRNLPSLYENAEPLYIDTPDSWHLRPDAYTRIPNLFLAADYVRTNTQLATMEGANEAARRAVNAIIATSGAKVPLCKIWPLDEPPMFSIWRWYDQRRYDRGEPWKEDFPWFIDIAGHLIVTVYRIWYNATGRIKKR